MEYNSELCHYGVKGMKWGVRRTAAQLGHVVAKGGRKVGNAISTSYKKRREEKRIQKLMSKPVRKLSPEEYSERMDRLAKEKSMLDLQRNVSQLDQKAVSAGKKFMQDVLVPAAVNAGKTQLTNFLNEKFGEALGMNTRGMLKAIRDGKKTLDDFTDNQVSRLSKRAENTGTIDKNLLGKKGNDDDDGGIDGMQVIKDVASGKLKQENITNAQVKAGSKSSEQWQNITKAAKTVGKPDDDSSDTTNSEKKNDTSSNTTSSEKEKKKAKQKVSSVANNPVPSKSDPSIKKGEEFLESQIDWMNDWDA